MIKTIWAISIFVIVFSGVHVVTGEKLQGSRKDISSSRVHEIIISGKLFCFVKHELIIPFDGIIIAVSAHPGQSVRAGEALARYRLTSEAASNLQRKVLKFDTDDLELQLAEIENKLAKLADNYEELRQLSEHDMAPADSLSQIGRDMELLKKRKANIKQRLPLEQALVEKEQKVVEEKLGRSLGQGIIPDIGILKSPIDGNVIWFHSKFRKGAEIKSGKKVISIGVLDPMIIRAEVHEIEALQLSLGDLADFTLESIPGKKFEARISRISWETATPQVDKPSYYEVEFEVENPEFILREGLRGRIILHKS